MEFKEGATIGEMYGPAMEIQTKEEADAYLESLVQWAMTRWGKSREEATAAEKSNLGYYSGYYDNETAQRVMRLFDCAHPIFGTTRPTPAEALGMGFKEGVERSND